MIGLFADSQGDLDAFDAAYELLREKGARRFLFAGGCYGDLQAWIHRRWQDAADGECQRVLSRFCCTPEPESPAYLDPNVARKNVDMMGDTLCCMVYDRNELTKEDLLNGLIFLHGKATEPKVVQIGPRYFLTPGPLGRAAEPTCALLEKDERNVRFSAFTLGGLAVIDRQLLAIDRKTKLQVK